MAVSVTGEEGTCEVTEISKMDGEASINNRKGKLIFFYEWDVKLNWQGECAPISVCAIRGRLYCMIWGGGLSCVIMGCG